MTLSAPSKGHRGRVARAVGAVLLVALVTGCTTETPAALTPAAVGVTDAERQFTALLTRPDADTARTQHDQLRQRVQRLLSTVLSMPPWLDEDPRDSERGCGEPFTAVDAWDATRVYLGRSYVTRALTPAEWVVAKTTVSDTAARAGFTRAVLVIDQPGNYQVELRDESGGRVSLGPLSIRSCQSRPAVTSPRRHTNVAPRPSTTTAVRALPGPP